MSKLNLKEIEKSLEKSGFVLEHNVTEKLKDNNWSVINNKYYVDDVQEIAREIDLIAYKTRVNKINSPKPIHNLYIYTTLIISCKKNEEKLWALLFRDFDKNNPNMDWCPIKNWTNYKILNFMLGKKDCRKSLIEKAKTAGIYDDIFEPTGHLFAYQEINKNNNTVQNQKDIFGAVSSLMKAESYEMGALERRKKDIVIYNFNLISIIDTELVKVHYKQDKVLTSEISEAKAIFNYIVKKQETASRIHFYTFNDLDKCLNDYNKLHEFNCDFFLNLYHKFYSDLWEDAESINILKQEFISNVEWQILYYYKREFSEELNLSSLHLALSHDKSKVEISSDLSQIEVNFLNNNNRIKTAVKVALKRIYDYSGEFVFIEDDDRPF